VIEGEKLPFKRMIELFAKEAGEKNIIKRAYKVKGIA